MTYISVNLFVLFFLLPIFNMLTSAPASESGDHDTFESGLHSQRLHYDKNELSQTLQQSIAKSLVFNITSRFS